LDIIISVYDSRIFAEEKLSEFTWWILNMGDPSSV
jgi:hypothetical protein